MTLEPYSPEKLDRLALRMLDLAATIREMANNCRQHEIRDFTLHDKKALEWLANLDRWTHRLRTELEMKVIDARATQRARATAEQSAR